MLEKTLCTSTFKSKYFMSLNSCLCSNVSNIYNEIKIEGKDVVYMILINIFSLFRTLTRSYHLDDLNFFKTWCSYLLMAIILSAFSTS